MNPNDTTSAYFALETDARRAAEDLRAKGCEVEVRSEAQEPGASGAILELRGSARDLEAVSAIIAQHNGTLNDTTQATSVIKETD